MSKKVDDVPPSRIDQIPAIETSTNSSRCVLFSCVLIYVCCVCVYIYIYVYVYIHNW